MTKIHIELTLRLFSGQRGRKAAPSCTPETVWERRLAAGGDAMSRDSFGAEFVRVFVIFLAGGFVYGLIEVAYRGHTHPSMFVLGGLCLVWIGGFDSFYTRTPPLWVQVLLGGLFITLAEFACGMVLNVGLGLRVWDYSNLPFNLLGQVTPRFCALWIGLSLPAVLLENGLRAALSR